MKTWYRFVIIVSLILVITSWSPAQKKISGKTETDWGLHTATFETPNGRIIVYLPDDVCPGDTISGSVSVDPVGSSERVQSNSLNFSIDFWSR